MLLLYECVLYILVLNFTFVADSRDTYEQLWWSEFSKERHHTVFHVKACSDVHVMISPELFDESKRNYRFHIGTEGTILLQVALMSNAPYC